MSNSRQSDSSMDQILDAFEAALQKDSESDIEEFLKSDFGGTKRFELLNGLIALKIYYCQKRGKQIRASEFANFGDAAVQFADSEILRVDSNATCSPSQLASKVESSDSVSGFDKTAEFNDVSNDQPDEELTLNHSSSTFEDPHATLSISSEPNSIDDEVKGEFSNEVNFGKKVTYFGEYELQEEIARGGMGVVYKARQVKLNRVVALKMILSGELAAREEVARFKLEAEAAANLDHPGIVPIYEIGEHNGQHYFSMAFVEGESLATRLKDGPLSPIKATEVLVKVIEAVSFAHKNGVVHRDLKPANILLDANDEPKVTDFGLAKDLGSNSDLTRTGAVMGSPSYMPPEQAAGKNDKIGPKSDVYSIGAVLYSMLTGRPPHQAANAVGTLKLVLEREPLPPQELVPGLPKDLTTICLKCLQKEPGRRYGSAKELAEEVSRFQDGVPIHARPVGRFESFWRWCKRKPSLAGFIATGLVLLLLLAIGGPIVAWQQTALRNEIHQTLSRSNFLLAAARYEQGQVSDSQKYLDAIPSEQRETEWHLLSQMLKGSDLTWHGFVGEYENGQPWTGRVTQVAVNAKHDLAAVAIWTGIRSSGEATNVVILDTATGEETKRFEIAHFVDDDGPFLKKGQKTAGSIDAMSISPDGTKIVLSTSGKASVWDIASGEMICALEKSYAGGVAFGPGGDLVACGVTWVSGANSNGAIRIWELGTKIQKHEITTSIPPNVIQFSPDGKQVACAGGRILHGGIPISGGKTSARWIELHGYDNKEPVKFLKGHASDVTCFDFSPDGKQICSGSLDGEVRLWQLGTEKSTKLQGHESWISNVEFSPDGASIVSCGDDESIRTWNTATSNPGQILRGHTDTVTDANFLSDGTRIISSSADNTWKLWDLNGSFENELGWHWNLASQFVQSQNGSLVASAADSEIVIWDTSSSELIKRIEEVFNASAVAISPDGQKIAAGFKNGDIVAWDLKTGLRLSKRNFPKLIRSVDFFSPSSLVFLSGSAGTIQLVDLETLGDKYVFPSAALAIATIPSSNRIVSESPNGDVLIIDLGTREVVKEFRTDKGAATEPTRSAWAASEVVVSSDARLLARSNGSKIALLNLESGIETRIKNNGLNQITAFGFLSQSKRLVVASGRVVMIFDASSGDELFSFKLKKEVVSMSANRVLIFGHKDKTMSAIALAPE